MRIKSVSAEIPPEVENQLVQDLEERRKSLSFLIELTDPERRVMPKASRRRWDFTETALLQAKIHPSYLPVYLSLVEFEKDVNLRKSLLRIYEALNAFSKRVKDTIMVVDSEAYMAARVFYKTTQTAAREGSEDAERIVKDMSYHFRRMRPGEIPDEDLPVPAQKVLAAN